MWLIGTNLRYNSSFLLLWQTSTGNHLEIQYKLLSYGIPLAALPIDSTGCVDNECHKIWVQQRRNLEQQQKKDKLKASSRPTKELLASATTTGAKGIGRAVPEVLSNTLSNGMVARPAPIPVSVAQAPSPYHVTSGLSASQIDVSQTQPSHMMQPQIPTESSLDVPGASVQPPAIYQIGKNDGKRRLI